MDEFGQRRFARTGFTDDRHGFSLGRVEGDVLRTGKSSIGEGNVIEDNIAFAYGSA